MKRLLLLTLALALLTAALFGCGNRAEPGTIKEGKKLPDVLAAVDERFEEKYGEGYRAIMMPMEIDGQYLKDFCGLDKSAYDEFAGSTSISMTNSDALFAVKAGEGQAGAVRAALEKRLRDLVDQYELYPVNGSYERALAGVVHQQGDYLFLIVVGVLNDAPDFGGDVRLAKETIDGMFN